MNCNEFKAARVKNGYTQKSLAKDMGMTNSTFSRKERGLINFKVDEVMALKNLLSLSVGEIDRIFFDAKVATKSTKSI